MLATRSKWLIGATASLLLVGAIGSVAQLIMTSGTHVGADGSQQALAYQAPATDTPAATPNATDTPQPVATATPTPTSGASVAISPRPTATPQPAVTPAAAAKPAATAMATPSSPYVGATYNTVGQPCHSTRFFVATISQWAIPPGCFATVYSLNPKNYPAVPSAFGVCNWWVQELHPNNHDILDNPKYRRGSTPVPGAAIYFGPNVQGASSDGHFAQVVAIAPDHHWILVTEMNFTWRGAGFGKVDYRYVQLGPGVTFIYSG